MIDVWYVIVVAAWPAAACYHLVRAWRGAPGVGIPFTYLACLAVIHYFGGILPLLTGPEFPSYASTVMGFRITGYAVAGLVTGDFLLTLAGQDRGNGRGVPTPPWFHERIAWCLVAVGLIVFFLGLGLGGLLPSLASVFSGGLALATGAFCLVWWVRWRKGNHLGAWLSLLGAAVIPSLTLVGQGFLSFSVPPIAAIAMFVVHFERRRLLVLAGVIGLLVLGLSLFPAYMAAREDIREAVWGHKPLSRRVEVVIVTVGQQWRPVDENSDDFLCSLNQRLNQNIIVGDAILYMKASGTSFGYGETLVDSLLAMVPRVIWLDKPVFAGGSALVTRYTGVSYNDATSVGIGHVGEFYVNFGEIGVAIGFTAVGLILGLMDRAGAHHLRAGRFRSFLLWFVPAQMFMHVTGSFAEATGGLMGAIVLCLTVSRLLRRPVLPATARGPLPTAAYRAERGA